MALRVTNLGGGAGRRAFIEVTIAADTNNYNVFDAAKAQGPADPTRSVAAGLVRVVLNHGVKVGSTSTALPAFTRGTGWGAGWEVELVAKGTARARIQGKPGAGGPGRGDADDPKFGEVGEQGGGGGGGQGFEAGGTPEGAPGGAGCQTAANGTAGTSEAPGTGGAGNFLDGNCPGGNGLPGGDALEAPVAGEKIHLRPEAGATIEIWSGGGGGAGGGLFLGASPNGRAGGAAGQAGEDSVDQPPTFTGGAPGNAYAGPSAAADIVEDGPGTIDRKGPIE